MYAVVDCDSFFASCEKVFQPDLEGRPVAVLSNNDGCVVARSRELKQLGVPMGAPYFKHEQMFREHRVAVFSANFHLYGDFSRRVLSILEDTGLPIEPYSIDEAFLDLRAFSSEDYRVWAANLRQKILSWTGVPVSIGIGPTKTLAKAATALAKKYPERQGITVLAKEYPSLATGTDPAVNSSDFFVQELSRLEVGDVWGIGFRLAPKLNQLGVKTAADLIKLPEDWMKSFSGIQGVRTLKELKGEDVFGWEVTYNEPSRRTMMATRSFGSTISSLAELEGAVASFVVRASYRLRKQQKLAGKIRVFAVSRRPNSKTRRVSAQRSMPYPVADTGVILHEAIQALSEAFIPSLGYKKAGILLSDLVGTEEQQLPLIDMRDEADLQRRERLMQAFDRVRSKHGPRGLSYALQAHNEWLSNRKRLSPSYTTRWQDVPTVRV